MRLESTVDADLCRCAMQAATTIIRITYRFETIARGRISEAPISPLQRLAAVEEAFSVAFDRSLGKFEWGRPFEPGLPLEAPRQPRSTRRPLINDN